MSDRQPYLEIEHMRAVQGPLYALHNLTREDLVQLMDALKSRRLLQAIRLQEPALAQQVRNRLHDDAQRLDIINDRLKHSLHDQLPPTSRPAVGHGRTDQR